MKNGFMLLFILLALVFPWQTNAQNTGKIRGLVSDSLSGQPLPGANIVLRETRWGTAADIGGKFSIQNVLPGEYEVIATMMGYTSKTVKITVPPAKTVRIQFALVPAVLPLFDEIQVTAQAVDPFKTSTPLAIIEKQAIAFADFTTTSEILGSQPGISIARPGGWGLKTVIQGMSDDQIVVLVNGSRVNQACPMGMDACVATIDPATIERIEVIKGPHTALYGSGNIGGVINIITQEPGKSGKRLNLRASLTTGYESVSHGRKALLNLTGGQEAFDFLLSVGTKKYESYRAPGAVVANSQFAETSLQARARWRWRQNQRLQFTLDRYQGRNLGYPATFAIIPKENRTAYILNYEANRLSALFSFLSLTASYQNLAHDMQLNPPQKNISLRGNSTSDTYGLRAEAAMTPGNRQVLNAGMEYTLWRMSGTRQDQIAGELQPILQVLPNAFNAYWGVFAEYQYNPTPRFSFKIGARSDLVRSGADTNLKTPQKRAVSSTSPFWSGNLGLLYEMGRGVNLALSLGKGFKAPTPVEQYLAAPMADGYFHLGTPGLAPEINESLRASLRWMHGPVRAEFAAYRNRLHNLIYPFFDPALAPPDPTLKGVKRYANIQSARVHGFEAQWNLALNNQFSLSGSSTYTRGEDQLTGEALPFIPPFQVVTRLKYKGRKLWAELTGRFVAAQKRYAIAAGEDATTGFSVFDLHFGLNFNNGNKLFWGVKNLLNRNYIEHLNLANIPEPGRNIYVKFSVNTRLSSITARAPGSKAMEAQEQWLNLSVQGMACSWCAKRLQRVLTRLEGVASAEVRFEDKSAKVRYRQGIISPEQILKEIKEAGFEGRVISNNQ